MRAGVVFAAQSGVREVVHETPERGVAIFGVLSRVEDVHVPEAIDVAVGREIERGVLRDQDEVA